jgi:sulfur-oxidizing protein SoxY
MNQIRRKFLRSAFYLSASAATIGTGLLAPGRAFAAYVSAAFDANDVSTALKAALGSDAHTPSDQIKVKAPDIAENGAVVPVAVSSTLPNVESITIIATNNPSPLTSTYMLTSDAVPYVSTRIKLGKTSDIIVVVKSDGKLYSASKEVKVTIGGCGG